MASTTTIAISPETRDRLRDLAAERGDTMDALIRRLMRNEQARRMGAALAERRAGMSSTEIEAERTLLAGSAAAVANALG
jgi:predicted transcriptional regulator